MMKKHLFALLASAVIALPVAAQTAPADEPLKVQDFAVFVDPPTGFVFVKMPTGWKFVGKVEQDTMASLPANVYTSLLPGREYDGVGVARREPAGRKPGEG